jgi:peptide deformylase
MKSVLKASLSIIILMLLPFIFMIILFSNKKTNINENNFSTEQINLINSGKENEKMNILNWFEYKDSLLLSKSSSKIIFLKDKNLDLLINRLYVTVTDTINEAVGIAAPQVGILKKIIWVKRHDKFNSPFEVYINPEITKSSDTLIKRNDACLSLPDIEGYSFRYKWIEVSYINKNGDKKKETITDVLTAHIFQHEIDHLNGIIWKNRQEKNIETGKTFIDNLSILK